MPHQAAPAWDRTDSGRAFPLPRMLAHRGMRYVLMICAMLLAAVFCYMVLDMVMQTGNDVANSHPW